MAKEWTLPRSSEELHRRYKFKDIEATKKELDEYLNDLIFDDHLDATSTNPIQNKPVAIAMAGKVNTVTGKGLSTNDYTDYDKAKVDMMPTITQADVDRWNMSSGDGWTPPIGYIWISTSNTDPGTLFLNTTWVQIKDRFLLSAGDTYTAGNTGGSATHTLAVNQLPAHNHDGLYWGSVTGAAFVYTGTSGSNSVFDLADPGVNTKSYNYSGTNHIVTGNTGSGNAINHMPPYLVVYMWERTA